MGITIGRNTTTVKFHVDHVVDGVEQFEAVFRILHVASLLPGEFLVVLLFHID